MTDLDSFPLHIQAIALAAKKRWLDDACHSRDFTITLKVTDGVQAVVIDYESALCAMANMNTGEVGYKLRNGQNNNGRTDHARSLARRAGVE